MAKVWSWIALVALISLAAGAAQTSPGRSLLQKAGLASAPASYTTLSFAHPQALPARLRSVVAAIHVSFVIHNASGSSAPRVYHWAIMLSHAGASLYGAVGQTRVPSGAGTTVNTTVLAVCTGGRLRLAVRLARPAESIDFWTACRTRNGGTP